MIKFKFNELLKKHNKTVYEVHYDTGVSLPTLYRLNKLRNKNISLQTINTLCIYFNCNVQDLFEFIADEREV